MHTTTPTRPRAATPLAAAALTALLLLSLGATHAQARHRPDHTDGPALTTQACNTAKSAQGTVKWFSDDKGFGFVTRGPFLSVVTPTAARACNEITSLTDDVYGDIDDPGVD